MPKVASYDFEFNPPSGAICLIGTAQFVMFSFLLFQCLGLLVLSIMNEAFRFQLRYSSLYIVVTATDRFNRIDNALPNY